MSVLFSGARLRISLGGRGGGWRSARWSLLHLLAGLLAVPFIAMQNAWFEWANSLWLLQLQTEHVAAHGPPTFFIHEPGQLFYPVYVFYAGPLLSVLAYPAAVIGAWPVFAATTIAAFVAASAGVGWTARNLGVPAPLAVVPGLLFATTPYLVSDLYGRGAWTELVAVAALVVALGAAMSLLTGAAELPGASVLTLAIAVAVVAGTHNITLLFGGLVAPLLLFAVVGPRRSAWRVTWPRLGVVAVAAVLGAALCGVFLAPNVWLSPRTIIAESRITEFFLRELHGFDRPDIILSPLLRQPPDGRDTYVYTQAAVVALLWCLLAAAVLSWRSALDRTTRRSLLALGAVAVVVTVLIADPSWWLSFPRTLQAIQFPFRLVPYLSLAACLGVAVLLAVPAARRSRLLVGALLAALVWQGGLATYQVLSAERRSLRPAPTIALGDVVPDHPPPSFVGKNFGQPIQFKLVPQHPLPHPPARVVASVGNDTPDSVVLTGRERPGTLVATRVVDSPLIRFDGDARRVGVDRDSYVVLQVDASARTPFRATVTSACKTCLRAVTGEAPLALLAGKLVTLIGLAAIVGFVLAARRRAPRRRGAESSARSA